MVRCRVGQNRIYAPYMTAFLVISFRKIPYIHRIYMDLANPSEMQRGLLHCWVRPSYKHQTLDDSSCGCILKVSTSLCVY